MFFKLAMSVLFFSSMTVAGDLATFIDRRVTSGAQSADGAFLRKLSLDLNGQLPHENECRSFIADSAKDKRVKKIDAMLNSIDFSRRMQHHLDVVLMERHSDRVADKDWWKFIYSNLEARKPFSKIAWEILRALPQNQAANKFYTDRSGRTDPITNDVSRLFMGKNLQCAQCHDDPMQSDYEQKDYFGIFAAVNRTYLVRASKDGKYYAGEYTPNGPVTFKSVYTGDVGKTYPALFGQPLPTEPKRPTYYVKPGSGVVAIPKYSRRARLANAIVASPQFSRNFANRFWKMMMGKGLIEPVDYDHSGNPPSDAALMKRLTTEFKKGNHQLRAFLKEIALSKAYQNNNSLRALSPEQLLFAMIRATDRHALEEYEILIRLKKTNPAYYKKVMSDPKLKEKVVYDYSTRLVRSIAYVFGGSAGSEEKFQAQTRAAFYMKHNYVRRWTLPWKNNAMSQLTKMTDPQKIVERLTLRFFCRYPKKKELAYLVPLIKNSTDLKVTVPEIAWAMMASVEFRFIY